MKLISFFISTLVFGQALHITGAHTSPTYSVALVGSLPSSGCAIGEVAIVGPATATPSFYVNSTAGTCTWTALLSGSGTVTNSGTLTANAIVSGNGGVNITTPNTNATIDSSGNIVTPGTISGGTSGTAGSIKFYDSGGTNFTGWSAPTSLSGGCLLDIPAGDPAGQVLQFAAPSGGHCAGSWISAGGGSTIPSTTHIICGNGSGNGALCSPDLTAASLPTLSGANAFTNNQTVQNGASTSNLVTIGNISSNDGYPGLWLGQATPSFTNYALLGNGSGGLLVNSATAIAIRINNAQAINVTATLTAVTNTFQVTPTSTNPTCSAAGDIGKFWFDSTTSTTSRKTCNNVAGTPTWVTF